MGRLIRDILEDSAKNFAPIKAVKWLKKKEIFERSYQELMDNVVAIRKGSRENTSPSLEPALWSGLKAI